MNLIKYALYAVALSMVLPAATAAAKEPDKKEHKAERSKKTRTPYSNEAQAKKRLIRDAIREADKPKKGSYTFRRTRDDKDD